MFQERGNEGIAGTDSVGRSTGSGVPFRQHGSASHQLFYKHGTANEQMRGYYLLGRAYDCKRNPVLALRFYQEAIEKADTSASDIDYVTLSRAYAHSSKLFNGNFDTSFSTLWFYSVFFNYVAIL